MWAVRPRALDGFVLDQDTTLWIVVALADCLILGIALRALLAERRRERKPQDKSRTDVPNS